MSMYGQWKEGDLGKMNDWTAEQHLDVAVKLLEGNHVPFMGEDGEGTTPPWLSYARDADQSVAEPIDYSPFLAAITHALVGIGMSHSQLANEASQAHFEWVRSR